MQQGGLRGIYEVTWFWFHANHHFPHVSLHHFASNSLSIHHFQVFLVLDPEGNLPICMTCMLYLCEWLGKRKSPVLDLLALLSVGSLLPDCPLCLPHDLQDMSNVQFQKFGIPGVCYPIRLGLLQLMARHYFHSTVKNGFKLRAKNMNSRFFWIRQARNLPWKPSMQLELDTAVSSVAYLHGKDTSHSISHMACYELYKKQFSKIRMQWVPQNACVAT